MESIRDTSDAVSRSAPMPMSVPISVSVGNTTEICTETDRKEENRKLWSAKVVCDGCGISTKVVRITCAKTPEKCPVMWYCFTCHGYDSWSVIGRPTRVSESESKTEIGRPTRVSEISESDRKAPSGQTLG